MHSVKLCAHLLDAGIPLDGASERMPTPISSRMELRDILNDPDAPWRQRACDGLPRCWASIEPLPGNGQ